MIQSIADITKDKSLRQWLDRFFTQVDAGRKQRGLQLYQNRAVKDFQDKIFGFTARVEGSTNYNVSAFFEGVNKAGLPHLDHALFICSCPDSVIYCKHTVAAVIHWAVDMDWKKKNAQKHEKHKHSLMNQRATLGSNLKKLEQLATKEDPVSFAEHNALDWVFNPSLDEVMKNIHKIIKNGV